jgi:hypothetical protein
MIMHVLAAALLFLSQPFWDAKPPEGWTDREIDLLLTESPWAQSAGPAPVVTVYFATAAPVEEAESEVRVRGKRPLREPDPDYSYYLLHNRETQFVLAIPYPLIRPIAEAERKRMEEECVMVAGKKRWKMAGHFPPTLSDPVLRLVFPREVRPTDKSVVFRLYLPALDFPDREVEFRVKDMVYRGELAM